MKENSGTLKWNVFKEQFKPLSLCAAKSLLTYVQNIWDHISSFLTIRMFVIFHTIVLHPVDRKTGSSFCELILEHDSYK